MILGKAISPFALRKKSSGVPTDADAQAFITATGITGTNATATNQLVLDLKAANIWTKMKAVYPIVGGSATAHKFNLKDPRDLDAAFRLVFSGGVTHSSSGIKGNNTNAWADTKLVPSTSLILNNFHYSFNTYTDALGTFAQGHISSQVSSTSIMQITSNNSNSILGYTGSTTSALSKTLASANHKGFWCGSRTANNDSYLLDPTGIFTSNTTAITYTNPSLSVGLMTVRISSPVNYSNFGYSFFSIGYGLTTSETTSLKTAVNNFQATLGRI